MPPEPRARRLRIGLRGRLILALAVTSVVTLAVAALTLFAPLERRLRNDRLDSLASSAAGARQSLERVHSDNLRPGSEALTDIARALRRRTGADVVVVDSRGRPLVSTDFDAAGLATDARRAVATTHVVRRVIEESDGKQDARVALRFESEDRFYTLILTKSLDDVTAAVASVKRSFVTAALVGLGVALVIGALIATGLVRRLRDLRLAALKVAALGPTVELAPDSRRDEVADLTRAFTTMQERLREQEQARRAFVATASHELRTPLASLMMMVEMLDDDLAGARPDVAEAREHVGRVRSQGERLSKLAAELLDLSRIDAGLPLREELVELGELSRAVVAEFSGPARRAAPDLRLEAPARCWAVADPGSVARIVRILIDNAIRFSPPDAPVQTTVSCDADGAAVSVCDSGPGVPEHERELIFERFRRGGDSGGDGGFGLGLAIGSELAHKMGGELTLDDTASGACFRLRLPAAPELPDAGGTHEPEMSE